MNEQGIQKKILTYLDSIGAYSFKVLSANKSGVHDIVGCYKGKFFSVEVKTPVTQKNVSPLQAYNLRKVIASGGYSIIAWDVSQVKQMIGDMDEATI